MIARVWHGRTKPENADTYEAMLKPELLPGVSKVKGYQGSYLLRKDGGRRSSSSPFCFGDSIDSVRAFAGPDYETSIVPEDRRKYLSQHDEKASHYKIVATHKPG